MCITCDGKTFYDITICLIGCLFEFDKQQSRWLIARLILGFSIHFIELSVTLAVDREDIYFAKEFILNQTSNIIEQNSFIHGNFIHVIPESSRVYTQFYLFFSRYINACFLSCFILNGGFILLSVCVLLYLCIKYKYDYVVNLRGRKSFSYVMVHYVLFSAFKLVSMWTSLFLIFTSLVSFGAHDWKTWIETGLLPDLIEWKEWDFNLWLIFYSMFDFCLSIFDIIMSALKKCCNIAHEIK